MTVPVNVVCMKWGALYGPHYVNRLYGMVARRLSRPFRFACFTDDPGGLRPEVETFPLPPIELAPEHAHRPWRKIGLFNPTLGDLTGTALFLDLDLVIVDDIDPLFDHAPGRFCIIRNWTRPDRRVGNSSVYRFEIGADAYVLERFRSASHEHWIERHRNSQTFLSDSVRDIVFWPPEWCVSFKKQCLPGGPMTWLRAAEIPAGARVVVFHGHPNPDEALEGRWPGGWWKRLRPAPWIAEHWRE